MKHTIRRTYLTKRVETWVLTSPDNENFEPAHMITEHFSNFDTDLCNGGDPLGGWTSVQVSEDFEMMDHDELALEVVERQPANVIPIGRKDRR